MGELPRPPASPRAPRPAARATGGALAPGALGGRYGRVLLDHFRSPRNAGMMPGADAVGESEDPTCGDVARFYLRVEAGRVREVCFQTYGCGPAIAASSLLTELVRGRLVGEASTVTAETLERELGGLPPDRRHVTTLVTAALQAACGAYGEASDRA